jgi:hypothetical protein
VTDRVDAAMEHVQPALLDAVVDRVEGEPERLELTPCHDTLLLVRKRCDGRVRGT